MTCHDVKPLLLDHLYGALNDADASAVQAHLRDCDACRAALADARSDRDLLAEAARVAAGDLVLAAPSALPSPTLSPWPRRISIAAAASILLAAGALGWTGHARTQALLRNPHVSVLAPRAIPPGQAPEFLVQVATVDGVPLPADVRVRVSSESGAQLAEKTVKVDSAGKARVAFAADLGGPTERLRVDVAARLGDGIERSATTMVVRDATRLLARVSTDKPLYRPGETVRVRAVALDRFRLTPPPGVVGVQLKVLDPHGAPVHSQTVAAPAGIGGWEWQIPEGAAGGEYRVVASDDQNGRWGTPPVQPDAVAAAQAFPPTERTFVVRSYRVPRLESDVELNRDSYGPGDSGEAWLSIERAEGGVPAGAALEAVVSVDGAEVSREKLQLPASGRATVKFTLPKEIREGRGQVAVVVRDGGNVETVTETIPIVLDRLDVAFFPEGGDLVAGLRSRVYFQVRDPKGEPADLDAEVLDSAGRHVADAKVDDLGLGRFELTPAAGETYRIVARKPAKATLSGAFPAVVAEGVVLRALDDVTSPRAPVRIEIASTRSGRHSVAAYCRGVMVAQDIVDLDARKPRVVSLPVADVGGVLRVTVLDPTSVPAAERLVSMAPPHRIDVAIEPSATAYSPGDTVTVRLRATDEEGRPVKAFLGATVVDEAVISLADDEDTPSLPLHFLLGLEVEELEKCDVYANGPNAARAVDRLLGVQGWRRFAWRDPQAFLAKNAENGARVVVASVADVPERFDNGSDARDAVAYEVSTAWRDVGETGAALAVAFAGLGGLILLVMGAVTRRPGRMVTGLAGAVLAAVVVVPAMQHGSVEQETMGFDGMIAAAAEAPRRMPAGAAGPALVEEMEAVWAERPEWLALAGRAGEVPRNGAVAFLFRPGGGPGAVGGAVRGLRLLRVDDVALLDAEHLDKQVADALKRLVDGRQGDFARRIQVFAREYRHTRRPDHDGTRTDFAEVLYWNHLLATDDQGRAQIAFDTSDSVTTFTIGIEAHDARGALAAAAAPIRNRIPFYLEPKLPVELSAGDVLRLPVVIANDTGEPMDVTVDASVEGAFLRLVGAGSTTTQVPASARGRVLYELVAQHGRGTAKVALAGRGVRGLQDRSVRAIPVVPRGYPVHVARGGVVEKIDAATFPLPEDLDRATLTGSLRLYPSMLSTLVEGLDSMLQEPCGCFEQASSTNYPNVLVLTYLSEQDAAAPDVARRARDLLKNGYAKLTGYECKQRGYEWFGGDPGHEALSAYGLMEFADMARVHDVDAAMITRTRDWLLARRDGRGGFGRNARALDSFGGAPQEVTDAYIVWALTEADDTTDLTKELAALEARGRSSDDPYVVALAANALANRRLPGAKSLLERLASMQGEDGRLAGKTTSITSSSGINLDVETTALAVMAFVTDPARLPNAESGVRFLAEQRRNGGAFGATQATILALRALIEHARAAKRTSTDHDIVVAVNGREVARRFVAAGEPGTIEFGQEVLDALLPGENRIEVRTSGAETLPWALALEYHTNLPPTDPDCAVDVTTRLARTDLTEGETVRLDVTLRNRRPDGVPMTLARIGLPAGLEPRAEQLREMKEQGVVAFYETRPREVTLYFRGMAPSEEKCLALDLVAEIPGDFEGPATSAYLYYTDDRKTWAPPLAVRIGTR